MSVASAVKQLIADIGPNVLFSTRQILSRCRTKARNAVDLALRRLVEKAVIMRIAAGQFILISKDLSLPSAVEVARAKAETFGKRIYESNEKDNLSFLSNGCKSSFKSVHGRISLKHIAPGKIAARSIYNFSSGKSESETLQSQITETKTEIEALRPNLNKFSSLLFFLLGKQLLVNARQHLRNFCWRSALDHYGFSFRTGCGKDSARA